MTSMEGTEWEFLRLEGGDERFKPKRAFQAEETLCPKTQGLENC